MRRTEGHSTEPLAMQLALGAGSLVTGDLGLVAIRGMLENGVGYVVGSWSELPTPIDVAVDDARSGVFARRGIVLRRLRTASALEQLVTSPAATWVGSADDGRAGTARGVVIFGGRRGMRPMLERFVQVPVPGAVVGICHDIDAARIANAAVLDPEPTAAGFVAALDQAFEISARTGRPALVLVRPRLLGMRGTIRCRDEVSPQVAAARDASLPRSMPVPLAAVAAGALRAEAAPSPTRDNASPVLVAVGPAARVIPRALSELAHRMDSMQPGSSAVLDRIAVVTSSAAGIVPDTPTIADLLVRAPSVCLIAAAGAPCAQGIDALLDDRPLYISAVDADAATGDMVCRAIGRWVAAALLDESHGAELSAVLVGPAGVRASGPDLLAPHARVPRRGASLHRSVSPSIAAGLALAQGVIGVPTRLDPAYPTYSGATAVPLTIVPTDVFVEHGLASAAPGSSHGVFVVTGSGAGVAEQAAAIGATIDMVDGGAPRSLGVAIARACQAPRVAPHVILVTEPQHHALPRTQVLGIDPELVGTDRIATSSVPRDAIALVDYGSELVAGPVELVLDTPTAVAKLPQLRELSPATWDLTVRNRGHRSRWSHAMWTLRRRMVRTAAGVDL